MKTLVTKFKGCIGDASLPDFSAELNAYDVFGNATTSVSTYFQNGREILNVGGIENGSFVHVYDVSSLQQNSIHIRACCPVVGEAGFCMFASSIDFNSINNAIAQGQTTTLYDVIGVINAFLVNTVSDQIGEVEKEVPQGANYLVITNMFNVIPSPECTAYFNG